MSIETAPGNSKEREETNVVQVWSGHTGRNRKLRVVPVQRPMGWPHVLLRAAPTGADAG